MVPHRPGFVLTQNRSMGQALLCGAAVCMGQEGINSPQIQRKLNWTRTTACNPLENSPWHTEEVLTPRVNEAHNTALWTGCFPSHPSSCSSLELLACTAPRQRLPLLWATRHSSLGKAEHSKGSGAAESPEHTQTHALAGSSSLCATDGTDKHGVISGRRAAALALTDRVRHELGSQAGSCLVLSPAPGVMLSTRTALSCLSLAQPDRRRRGRVHVRGSSWLPAHPRSNSACPALSKALSQPQEKRLGGGSQSLTASSPEVSAAAQRLQHTRNVLLLPARPPLLCDGHQDLLRGRGSHCKNAQGIMTDPHTCVRHCWTQPRSLPDPPWVLPRPARAVPGQSMVLNPDPARSNRQGDQFSQFCTTATHTAAPGTGTWA